MPAPQVVSKRVQAIHRAMLDAGLAGKRILRRDVEYYLASDLGMGPDNIRVHIDHGRTLRLWDIIDRRPRPSLLIVHPPKLQAGDPAAA